MKTGDKVRFLNAVGGGVVTRIDAKNQIVYVADSDGFEIPTLAADCVVIAEVNPETNFVKKNFVGKILEISAETSTVKQEIKIETQQLQPALETPEGDKLAVFAAFIPQNIKQLQTCACDFVLINDSNYYLFYNIVLENANDCKSISSGIIEPNTLENLLTVGRENLNDWEKPRIQITAYKKDKAYQAQNVIDTRISLDLTKFYKLHCFTENDYFEQPAMLIDIVAENQKSKLKNVSETVIMEVLQSKRNFAEKHISKSGKPENIPLEIDLHINQLLDTTAGMSNAEMLNYQLDTVRKTLDGNKGNKGKKIVFIHGKGEGVLRSEIEKLLKTKYKSCTFQDASFRQYGFGATMVTVR